MRKTWVYSIALLWVGFSWAQDLSIDEKYDRTFAITDRSNVEIVNKYGEVILNTWYRDSVRIFVRVSATGKNRDDVSREMDRVDIELRQIGNLVTGITSFDQKRSKGFFGELLDQVSDYSQTMIGSSKKLSVDFEVWMPADLPITVENKFGDVYLANFTDNISVDVSHGDIRGNEILGNLNLKHSFGKFRFDYVERGTLTLRGVEGKINRSDYLSFESSSSEFDLGEIKDLQINSRNDKFQVEQLYNAIGEGSFTDLNVDLFLNEMQLSFNYGEIFLSSIDKDFEKLRISGKSTDINLILDQASYINTRIVGEEDKMILPNSMLVMKKDVLEEEERIILSGYVGNTNTTHSDLDLDLRDGELIISIKETDIFTNRN